MSSTFEYASPLIYIVLCEARTRGCERSRSGVKQNSSASLQIFVRLAYFCTKARRKDWATGRGVYARLVGQTEDYHCFVRSLLIVSRPYYLAVFPGLVLRHWFQFHI